MIFIAFIVYHMNFNVFIIILMSDCVVVILFQSSCANLWNCLYLWIKQQLEALQGLPRNSLKVFKPFSPKLLLQWFYWAVSSQQQVSDQLVTVSTFNFTVNSVLCRPVFNNAKHSICIALVQVHLDKVTVLIEAPLGVFRIRDIRGKNYQDTGLFEEKVFGIQHIEK